MFRRLSFHSCRLVHEVSGKDTEQSESLPSLTAQPSPISSRHVIFPLRGSRSEDDVTGGDGKEKNEWNERAKKPNVERDVARERHEGA